jgi:hypothetical protein
MDQIATTVERIMSLERGAFNPVVFDIRLDPTMSVFSEFADVLIENKCLRLPYSSCVFSFTYDNWERVSRPHKVPLILAAWEDSDVVSVLLFSGVHYEPICGLQWTISSGRVEYAALDDRYADTAAQDATKHAAFLFGVFKGIIASLATKGVSERVDKPNERINRKRISRGDSPLPETHVVFIDGITSKELSALAPSDGFVRSGPRPHYRRGHVRKLSDGRVTMVSACIVAGSVATPKKYIVQ